MVKVVGRSGQLSLGKRYAGQYYDVEHLNDGVLVLVPVTFVPQGKPDRHALDALLRKREK